MYRARNGLTELRDDKWVVYAMRCGSTSSASTMCASPHEEEVKGAPMMAFLWSFTRADTAMLLQPLPTEPDSGGCYSWNKKQSRPPCTIFRMHYPILTPVRYIVIGSWSSIRSILPFQSIKPQATPSDGGQEKGPNWWK